jgi:hypothetical protein
VWHSSALDDGRHLCRGRGASASNARVTKLSSSETAVTAHRLTLEIAHKPKPSVRERRCGEEMRAQGTSVVIAFGGFAGPSMGGASARTLERRRCGRSDRAVIVSFLGGRIIRRAGRERRSRYELAGREAVRGRRQKGSRERQYSCTCTPSPLQSTPLAGSACLRQARGSLRVRSSATSRSGELANAGPSGRRPPA